MGELERHLGLLALGMARCLPLVWLVPAFGGASVSPRLRLALGGALSALCLPILSARVPDAVGLALALLVLREVLVGAVMGFVCACWFRAAEAAGSVVDALCGLDLAVADPQTCDGRSGAFGAVMLLFAVVVFFEIGGVGHVALAVARSYDAIPISAPLSAAATTREAAFTAIASSGMLIEAALGLSAPVVLALILADFVLGVIGRVAPQVSGPGSGLPLRSLLGIGMLLLGMGAIRTTMQAGFTGFLSLMRWPLGLGR